MQSLRERAARAHFERIMQRRVDSVRHDAKRADQLHKALLSLGIESNPITGTVTVEGICFEWCEDDGLWIIVPCSCCNFTCKGHHVDTLADVGEFLDNSSAHPHECERCTAIDKRTIGNLHR